MQFKRTPRAITVKPVCAIKRLANIVQIKNALWPMGYNVRQLRNIGRDKLLGQLPRPVLERVLAYVSA